MGDFVSRIKVHDGFNNVSLPESFRFISGFGVLSFKNSSEYCIESQDNEIGLVMLEGSCNISFDGEKYKNLRARESVFSGNPTGVYIPVDSRIVIDSQNATIAVCKSKCSKKTEPAVIYPEEVKRMDVGKDNWKREVRIIIGPESPSVNLIVGETINPAGNWSGTPPHKHESKIPSEESLHEELYYFKTDKPQGWGIERVYSPERGINELIYLEENTVTFMPWGYHQIVAAPGYTLYYLFFLAGEGKELMGYEDPNHNWIKGA